MSEPGNVIPLERKPRPGGRKLGRERLRELEAENAELRRLLDLSGPTDIDLWEQLTDENTRDEAAARALVQEWGNVFRAAERMGFELETDQSSGRLQPSAHDLIRRIFDRPGVKAKVAELTAELSDQRKALLTRQAQIARFGDDDASVRAFSQIAKIMGWQTTPDTLIDNRKINLYTLLSPQNGTAEGAKALPAGEVFDADFLGHEPGDPVRITTGDERVDDLVMQGDDGA